MTHVDSMFYALAAFAGLSMIVLFVGSMLTLRLRQPIERVRCIQWTLLAIVAAFAIRQMTLLPALSLPLLPAASVAASTETSIGAAPPHLGTASVTPLPNEVGDPGGIEARAVLPGSPRATTEEAATIVTETDPVGRTGVWGAVRLACVALLTTTAGWYLAALVVGRWRLRHLTGTAVTAPYGLLMQWGEWPHAQRRGTRVLVSSRIQVPITFGVWRPVIMLPERLLRTHDIQQLHYCLTHEWAHIQRHDVVTWWFLHLLQPVLWFQPLFWFLRRELRTSQDQLADGVAVSRAGNRADYAEFLVGLAKGPSYVGGLALTMADRRSSLFRRIELLLSDGSALIYAPRRGVVVFLSCVMVMIAVGLGVLRVERARAQDDAVVESTGQTEETAAGEKEQPEKTSKPDEVADAETLAFSGFVLSKKTKLPIRDATVVVRRMILKSNERRVLEESKHKTNSLGRYDFKIPREQVAERYLYIELDVEHPKFASRKGFGYALSMIRKNLRLGEPPFFAKVELSPADPITGRIVDPQGNPLAGVRMLAYSKGSADDFRDYGSFFRAKSDEDGNFRLNMVEGGPSVFWIVPHDYVPRQIVSGAKRGDWGEIEMQTGVSVTGKVVSATGQPVAGVWVNLTDQAAQREIQIPVSSALNRTELTDKDGKFTLRPVKPGSYRVEVGDYPREIRYHDRPDRNPVSFDDVFIAQNIDVGPQDANRPITIQAIPHVEFHGQYLDSQGQPTRGHEVMVWGHINGQWYHTTIRPDADGKIVGRLPHGLEKASMNAITNEHSAIQVRLTKGGPLMGGRELELGDIEDDLTDIEVIRYQAPIVQINAVDESGRAIRDYQVAGVYEGDQELMHPVDGLPTHIFFEKQSDGRYRSSQMIPEKKVTFTAKSEGYQVASQTLSLPEGDETQLTLVLVRQDASQ